MLLSLNNITFEFGARKILDEASWHIYANERIGLIGPNGTGKSTLLKILIGEYSVSGGSVNRSKNLSIGYFHQDLQSLETNDSIHQVAMGAFERALQIQQDIRLLEEDIEKASTDEKLHKLADLYHDFEVAGGYEMEYKSAEVLEGLGFATKDLTRSFKEFSGGWRMRVILAKMILQKPDILLLDEPTNHLDLPSIEWIEKYLLNYQGTVIIVSHDRYFLDRMVTKIVEISQQTLIHYGGNYSFYEQEKEVRTEFQLREYENQKEYIAQQERFIERFRAKATKAKQAQSAIKKLDRLDRIEAPVSETSKINFSFQAAVTPGKIISTIHQISKHYGDIEIFNKAEAEIMRGDKIALIGANGRGKSTLLRLIAGTETCEGEIKPGHNVEPSFYAQHQMEALDLNDDILDELKLCGSGKTEPELRELMGCFLFRGDDVFKKIRVLSGGEKARVALAKTIISKANFLLLDEPTNHLDISSVNMLIQALNKYEGTFILVSHDRYFISQTANRIWEIEDGKLICFEGNYDEWELFKRTKAEKLKAAEQSETPVVSVKPKQEEPVIISAPKNVSKERSKEEKKLRTRFEKLEQELNTLQQEQTRLELLLASPDTYAQADLFKSTESAYQQIIQKIGPVQSEYESLFEQLMSFE
ncbi:MAG: ATP-binding cassette domain-containing protein [Chitinophagaceae bacterium]|nr:ATP-binding cassette domain-containing protein [Chitinophagaceae bacterium]